MSPTKQRGRLARRLVIVIYAVALGYLIVVGFAAVIPDVFWPETDDQYSASCDVGFRQLHGEVEGLRQAYFSGKGSDLQQLRSALKAWDAKLASLQTRCDKDSLRSLERYRHRVELTISNYLRDERPNAQRLEQLANSGSEGSQ